MSYLQSRTLNSEISLTTKTLSSVMERYMELSKIYLLNSEIPLPHGQLEDIFPTWKEITASKRFRKLLAPKIAQEIFQQCASQDIKTSVATNQEKLNERVIEHAALLHRYGVYTSGLELSGISRLFAMVASEPWVGYINWLRDYDKKESLPDYDHFYLFHLPKIATELLIKNKAIDDSASFSAGLANAVELDVNLTIDASVGRPRERITTNAIYRNHLWHYAGEDQKKIILEILRKRAKGQDHKTKAVPISPDDVKEASGIQVVVSEAFNTGRPNKIRRDLGGGKAKTPSKPNPWSYPKK